MKKKYYSFRGAFDEQFDKIREYFSKSAVNQKENVWVLAVFRTILIFLFITAFSVPLWITAFIRRWYNKRKKPIHRAEICEWKGMDGYLLFQLVFLFISFYTTGYYQNAVFFFVVYFLANTVHYLLRTLLITRPKDIAGSQRSILLLVFNYIQINYSFAIIYLRCGKFYLRDNIIQLCPTQALYFSFVTAATIGYGDFTPADNFTMNMVILQSIVFILVISVMIGYFMSAFSRKKTKLAR